MDYRTILFAQKTAKNSATVIAPQTASGCPCVLEKTVGEPVISYRICGNSVQNGTPSSNNPVEIQSVGNPIENGEFSGKYSVPIVAEESGGEVCTRFIYINEPLRKTGSYADEIANGTVIRRNIQVVLDGSEVWTVGDANEKGLLNFKTVLADYPLNTTACADRLPIQYTSIANTADEGVMINANNLYVRKWKSGISDVEAFKQWLAENPITVQYIRQEAVAELADMPEIPTFEGTTTISVNTTVKPSDMEIRYLSRRV
ncbi:MAG: hypothetical protein NC340_10025 [Ruminococcus flavefaciens]|nr:hypothetical protein [Ruminococcus flavefaciens]MCM1229831.1 hypothetical protein [Ruminococcus flavefaciens]